MPAAKRKSFGELFKRALHVPKRRADPSPLAESPFSPCPLPPWASKAGAPAIAQDEAIPEATGWAWAAISSAYQEGVTFLGYPYLSILAQRPEYRRISEIIASEMTRKWIMLTSTGEDDDKSDKIKAIEAALKRLAVQDVFREAAEQDGFFGRGHIFLDFGTDDPAELKQPVGDGKNALTKAKVKKGSLKALRSVEAVWTYPMGYNSTNPLSLDWYKPQTWMVMGKEVHASRLLTLVGREVPDILKPAYSFGGLSLSQMAKPYVDNWLRTRQAVADLIYSYSTDALKTDLQSILQNDSLIQRADMFTKMRDNQGLMILGNEEEFFNVSKPLSTLDTLQAQTQEHMAAVSGIPIVKLLGIQPAGLNASSEGELRTFYDWVHSTQEKLFRKPLGRVIDFIQLSEFGEVDPEIDFEFEGLWQLDEAGEAAVQKTRADMHDAYIAMGAIDPQEVRQTLANDPESPYNGLDLDTPAPGPPEGEQQEGPEDRPDRLANTITGRAANFGGATSGGFKGDEAPLLEKSEVGFEHPAQGSDHCAECVHFRAPDACAFVEGRIEPEDWCRLFEREEK